MQRVPSKKIYNLTINSSASVAKANLSVDIFIGRLENVLKTSWRDQFPLRDTSWTHLENVLKTFWRGLQDVLTRANFARCQDVVKMRDQVEHIRTDLFKTSSEDKEGQRFQDVFKMSLSRRMTYPELFSFLALLELALN